MTRTTIPVEELFERIREDPEYVKEYDALEDEFALYARKTVSHKKRSRHAWARPNPPWDVSKAVAAIQA